MPLDTSDVRTRAGEVARNLAIVLLLSSSLGTALAGALIASGRISRRFKPDSASGFTISTTPDRELSISIRSDTGVLSSIPSQRPMTRVQKPYPIFLGVNYTYIDSPQPDLKGGRYTRFHFVGIRPLGFLAITLICAAYPTVTFIRGPVRRRYRRRRGLCSQCGYDLRGNTTGVCPECGLSLVT